MRPRPSAGLRLNRYLAMCGIASRRKAEEVIRNGEVRINGKTVFDLSTRVNPDKDEVFVGKKRMMMGKRHFYVMVNKPPRVLTSMSDPHGRQTVADFVSKIPARLFPVGRLDWDSEGLLLMTNDGEFAQRVSHPRFEIPKTYLAKVSGEPTTQDLRHLLNGISIIGGKAKALFCQRMERRGSDKYDWIKIMITEGRNRQVRQMFEKLGYDVLKLQRVAIGSLKLGTLEKGEIKMLDEEELAKVFVPPKEVRKGAHFIESEDRRHPARRKKPLRAGRTGANRAGADRPERSGDSRRSLHKGIK